MLDTLTPAERSKRMSRVKAKDSKAELTVRRLLHKLGFRYRLHDRRLPGCPDIVFRSRHKVVFVHGCFWHRHDDPHCKLARLPKSRLDFWVPKLEDNWRRDLRHSAELEAKGWRVCIVWECELRHMELIKNKLESFLTDEVPHEGR